MDILCLSTTDWDEIWGSRQNIMSRLADYGHRILFVERQMGPEQILRAGSIHNQTRKYRLQTNKISQIKSNLWTFQPPIVPPGRYYSHILNRMGQNKISHSLALPIKSLEFNDYVLWVYPPHSSPIIPFLNPKMVVYHCIDRFTAGQRGRKRNIIQQQENVLLQKADCVFVNSKALMEEYQAKTTSPITLVPSAVDISHFQSTDAIHPDIAGIPRPRLGFSGSLDARIDCNLIEIIALSRPDWHIVLLGDQRPGFKKSNKLHKFPNIHFLGKKPYHELPIWMNGFDVFLMPYIQNERTQYISPLKFYEYLAVGKPIVTSPRITG